LTRIQNDIDLCSEKIDVPTGTNIPALTEKEWNVRILDSVIKKMETQALDAGADETGGCLIGSVFLAPKSIVVTDILPPPPDSTSNRVEFILGVEGLERRIKAIERKTNGKVTYLGSWHSHPHGGGASGTDKKTAMRLLFVRNYEPTVCLIWTPDGMIQI
jgi:integrative and conjugative element protein (TIGR02256 family)